MFVVLVVNFVIPKNKTLNRLSLQIFWGCLLLIDYLNGDCCNVVDNAYLCEAFIVGCVHV